MRFFGIPVAFVSILVAGCGGGGDGPELGAVEGTVRMDGQPLEGATVTFQPQQGRPSLGETDGDGYYELQYTDDQMGAVAGKHRVEISTYREGDPDADDPARQQSQPERVPAKYNTQTELDADVKPGSNPPIDFNLDSQGEIIEPDSGGDSPQYTHPVDC